MAAAAVAAAAAALLAPARALVGASPLAARGAHHGPRACASVPQHRRQCQHPAQSPEQKEAPAVRGQRWPQRMRFSPHASFLTDRSLRPQRSAVGSHVEVLARSAGPHHSDDPSTRLPLLPSHATPALSDVSARPSNPRRGKPFSGWPQNVAFRLHCPAPILWAELAAWAYPVGGSSDHQRRTECNAQCLSRPTLLRAQGSDLGAGCARPVGGHIRLAYCGCR